MKNKEFVGQKWRLKFGLLYGGLRGIECALVAKEDAQVFDSRDNQELKRKFWSVLLGCEMEVECES